MNEVRWGEERREEERISDLILFTQAISKSPESKSGQSPERKKARDDGKCPTVRHLPLILGMLLWLADNSLTIWKWAEQWGWNSTNLVIDRHLCIIQMISFYHGSEQKQKRQDRAWKWGQQMSCYCCFLSTQGAMESNSSALTQYGKTPAISHYDSNTQPSVSIS